MEETKDLKWAVEGKIKFIADLSDPETLKTISGVFDTMIGASKFYLIRRSGLSNDTMNKKFADLTTEQQVSFLSYHREYFVGIREDHTTSMSNRDKMPLDYDEAKKMYKAEIDPDYIIE